MNGSALARCCPTRGGALRASTHLHSCFTYSAASRSGSTLSGAFCSFSYSMPLFAISKTMKAVGGAAWWRGVGGAACAAQLQPAQAVTAVGSRYLHPSATPSPRPICAPAAARTPLRVLEVGVHADDVGVREPAVHLDLPLQLRLDLLAQDGGLLNDLDDDDALGEAVARLVHLAKHALPQRLLVDVKVVQAQTRAARAQRQHRRRVAGCAGSIASSTQRVRQLAEGLHQEEEED